MKATPGEISPKLRAAAVNLWVDSITAEVVSRLRAAGIRPILLKGPSIERWLYADGAVRPYRDTDLLLPPASIPAAERIVRDAGFKRLHPGWQEVSHDWRRGTDGAAVDLHQSLFGVGCTPEAAWRELSANTGSIAVGGISVETLSRPGIALHVGLHATQHGAEQTGTLADVERLLLVADDRCWDDATRLAQRLDAMPAFAAGLRLHPAGAELAERLGLPTHRPPEVAFHADGVPPLVLGLEQLAIADGLGARARFVARKLAPSPSNMRHTSALARRGVIGLVLAYPWRALSILLRAPAALAAWSWLRRRARADR